METNPEDLQRTNKTYQVFKNVRGTSMYFEDAKKKCDGRVQKGSSGVGGLDQGIQLRIEAVERVPVEQVVDDQRAVFL